MSSSSDEESDFSDSEIEEYKEKPYELLKAGTYKVKRPNGAFRCPFCLGKKKQDYSKYDHLYQHAVGVSKGNRSTKQKANHLALATYMNNYLGDEAEPQPQRVEPPTEQTELYCWPWVGIVANIIREPKNSDDVDSSRYWLNKFSKYKPEEIITFWDEERRTAQAIIMFISDWSGFRNAMEFERSFEQVGRSKKEWDNRKTSPGQDLYGWFARGKDYKSEGHVGDYLRSKGELKTITDFALKAKKDRNKNVGIQVSEIDLSSDNLEDNSCLPAMEQQQNHRPDDGILLDDVILEILLWLPVKSLLRFRQVCKCWKSHISSYSFRKLHRQRHSSSPPLILTFHNSNHGVEHPKPGIVLDYYLTAFDLYGRVIQQFTLPISSEKLTMLSIPFQSKLLCFVDESKHKLFSYNPSTQKLFTLPDSPGFRHEYNRITFGYIPSKDEYILVHMVYKDELRSWVFEFLTFSISEDNFQLLYNEWRHIKIPFMFMSSSGVFVSRIFYWQVSDEDRNDCILSLDVETEVLSTSRLPVGPRHTLLELKDELYVMVKSQDSLEVNLWKFCTDGNGNKSWTHYKTFYLQTLGYTGAHSWNSIFNWKIFIYRLEYLLQCYNEPSKVLQEMGMLMQENGVVEKGMLELENVLLGMGMLKLENGVVDYYGEYFMPFDWEVNIHSNLFTL